MFDTGTHWGWFIGVALGSALAQNANCALAQITSDGTLGAEGSVVTPNLVINGISSDRIDGGAMHGNNLFHSFQQFNIDSNRGAYFSNPAGIENIVSRVIGSNPSNILGTLGVLGNANLFFINPNGIIFGPNARLDVNGSFFASTADSLIFNNGFKFSSTNPQAPPLLTINVPMRLQFGANPGKIQVQGNGQGIRITSELIDTTTGLRVQPNQTLALVGGDISLEGATLKTAGGRIELGSVASEGLVNLTPIEKGFSLGYAEVQNFGNIQMTQQASVDASGEGAGDIQVWGKRISLTDGSIIEASTLRSKQGGSLVINAQELLEIADITADEIPGGLYAWVYSGATGSGGNVNIQAGSVAIRNGGTISASTFGEGNAGRIEINVRDTVSLSGQGRSSIENDIGSRGVGDSGGISINTGSLFLSDKALITSNINGRGNSGGVNIVARDLVSLDDSDDITRSGTLILSRVNDLAEGNGGDITIKTGSLRASNSQITTSTSSKGNSGRVIIEAREQVALLRSTDIFTEVTCACETRSGRGGDGNGGDIKITTGSLFLDGGSNLRSDTEARGNAGNIFIAAQDSVIFSGSSDLFTSGAFSQVEREAVGRGGNINITTGILSLSGEQQINTRTQGQGDAGNIFIQANSISLANPQARIISDAAQQDRLPGTSGNGGDINITTNSLSITDRARVSANTEIRGSAGDITINANQLTLENRGIINSESVADQDGGNITLNIRDLMLIRGNSSISTNAGTALAGGNGGNITINAKSGLIVGVPRENSDITANAFSGSGGRVAINATGIFGITPLSLQDLQRLRPLDLDPRQLVTNDITAISQQNPSLSGQVTINTPDVDPSRGFVQLPTDVVNTPKLIASNCAAFGDGSEESTFTVTGRGGLPPNPNEPLSTDVVWSDTRLSATTTQHDRRETPAATPRKPKSETVAILPATGWVFNNKGEVTLISTASHAGVETTPATCPRP
ncbi:filamentous hemagglutinin N-terminal domain-containing protein [Iningainema tapete]|uniref:S-layer family protein n=1 Tax=Iningainema tapete BLCC-T55 TaxID=2748662 RepID=A0A8J6XQZ4_9CYAN|nr:S-layer family protein [Iningainema tapete]MBD2775806.1 S-layer family protein [Iningainema tapete BLCC-T55]